MAAAPRIVVADDSPFMRTVLGGALSAAGFDVVGTARAGDEALAQCRAGEVEAFGAERLRGRQRADFDLLMCHALDLAEHALLARVHERDGHSLAPDAARPADAMAESAFDLVPKPAVGEPFHTFTENLAERLRQAVARIGRAARGRAVNGHAVAAPRIAGPGGGAPARSSSPPPPEARALAQLLPRSRAASAGHADRPAHAGRLHRIAGGAPGPHVEPARPRSHARRPARPGTALVAPGGSHLRIDGTRQRAPDDEPGRGLRPRADLTIADVAAGWGERTLLVVLTGMGRDGAQGARAVRAAGGRILCEAAESCTVYGMPRAVIEDGLADVVLPLGELAEAIAAEAGA
jgi:two-component system chemotaxis response regulator CheB